MVRLLLPVLISLSAYAAEHHGAHDHGKAQLNIAFQGNTATVQFEAPAASVYGFEHEAKSDKEIKARDSAVNQIKGIFDQMLVFDIKLGCSIAATKVEPFVAEGTGEHAHDAKPEPTDKKTEKKKAAKEAQKARAQHGDFRAELHVQCQGNPAGTDLKFAFWKFFPQITTVMVQMVSDKNQSGGMVSKKNDSLKI